MSYRVNRRYHVHWLIETSFGPAYEADINASDGFRNPNPLFYSNAEVSYRVNGRYRVYWLKTSFGPAYEAGIDASEGFRNLIPPYYYYYDAFRCDLYALYARDSIIDGCRSILDAYDAGREAIFRFGCRFAANNDKWVLRMVINKYYE
jgi:hypothetical protein